MSVEDHADSIAKNFFQSLVRKAVIKACVKLRVRRVLATFVFSCETVKKVIQILFFPFSRLPVKHFSMCSVHSINTSEKSKNENFQFATANWFKNFDFNVAPLKIPFEEMQL